MSNFADILRSIIANKKKRPQPRPGARPPANTEPEIDVSQLTWNDPAGRPDEPRTSQSGKHRLAGLNPVSTETEADCNRSAAPAISPSGHLNLPPTGLELQRIEQWESRVEQSKNHPFPINPIRKGLFRDQPAADSLSSSSNVSDNEWLQSISNTGDWNRRTGGKGANDPQEQIKLTHQLFHNLFELFTNYARQFNSMVDFPTLKIQLTEPDFVSEKRLVRKTLALSTVEKTEEIVYERWRLSSRSWSISARAIKGLIEVFIMPCSDVMLLSNGEQSFRRRLTLQLREGARDCVWMIDGLPAGTDDIRVATRQIFKELIRNTQDNEQPLQETTIEDPTTNESALQNSISKLMAERQNLAQKVVIQQEDIQKRIARDLHDAIISDVMSIKRDLLSSDQISREDVVLSLEKVVQQLREICYELSPRDLGDWGLQVVLEDLLESISERSGADCVLNCDVEIPALPGAVELHIYRIVQECLNNVAKYAEATRVAVTIDFSANTLSVVVADNGKGFNPDKLPVRDAKSGGYGMTSIRERVELIRCFFPARLHIQSTPDKGTQTRLELDLLA